MSETTPGRGPRMLNARPVVPADLHAAFCGWRTRTPDDVEPDVAWCAGCGLPVAQAVEPEVVDLAARLAPYTTAELSPTLRTA
jgi:hypothetical protein